MTTHCDYECLNPDSQYLSVLNRLQVYVSIYVDVAMWHEEIPCEENKFSEFFVENDIKNVYSLCTSWPLDLRLMSHYIIVRNNLEAYVFVGRFSSSYYYVFLLKFSATFLEY